jgi:hypothetical protein
VDIIAHGLWAGIGIGLARRRWPIRRKDAIAAVAFATLPDLAQLVPLLGNALSRDGIELLAAYATAVPGSEPSLTPGVAVAVHHLHCALHSAVIAAAVTAIVWLAIRSLWIPLLGWWSHIVIDVFTHSRDYYPVPVFYPVSDWAFDGIAWNTPWFLLATYLALGLAAAAAVQLRRRPPANQ